MALVLSSQSFRINRVRARSLSLTHTHTKLLENTMFFVTVAADAAAAAITTAATAAIAAAVVVAATTVAPHCILASVPQHAFSLFLSFGFSTERFAFCFPLLSLVWLSVGFLFFLVLPSIRIQAHTHTGTHAYETTYTICV